MSRFKRTTRRVFTVPLKPKNKVDPVTIVAQDNFYALRWENQIRIFRNPRGLKYYYCFVRTTDGLEIYMSANGIEWSYYKTLALLLPYVAASGVSCWIHEDPVNNRLVLYVVASENYSIRYWRFVISDDQVAWAETHDYILVEGTESYPKIVPFICRANNGYLWLGYYDNAEDGVRFNILLSTVPDTPTSTDWVTRTIDGPATDGLAPNCHMVPFPTGTPHMAVFWKTGYNTVSGFYASWDGTTFTMNPPYRFPIHSPTSIGAGTWLNPENAFSADNLYASSAVRDETQEYYGFFGTEYQKYGIIEKVEVGIEQYSSDGDDYISVAVSKDGGATYSDDFPSTAKIVDNNILEWIDVTTAFARWNSGNLADTSFYVRVKHTVVAKVGVVYLDWIVARVTVKTTAVWSWNDTLLQARLDNLGIIHVIHYTGEAGGLIRHNKWDKNTPPYFEYPGTMIPLYSYELGASIDKDAPQLLYAFGGRTGEVRYSTSPVDVISWSDAVSIADNTEKCISLGAYPFAVDGKIGLFYMREVSLVVRFVEVPIVVAVPHTLGEGLTFIQEETVGS